ncbi:MAG: PTS sugar transporter subunit IIA [Acidobacteriota bacterium]
MDLAALADPERMFPEVPGFDAPTLLRAFAQRLVAQGTVRDPEDLYHRLWEREQLGSTGIGHGVAVPHCKLGKIDEVILALGKSADPIDFGAVDGKPVQLFFVVISPEKKPAAHLQCLSAISRWVQDEDNVQRLVAQTDAHSMYRVLQGDAAPETAADGASGAAPADPG